MSALKNLEGNIAILLKAKKDIIHKLVFLKLPSNYQSELKIELGLTYITIIKDIISHALFSSLVI